MGTSLPDTLHQYDPRIKLGQFQLDEALQPVRRPLLCLLGVGGESALVCLVGGGFCCHLPSHPPIRPPTAGPVDVPGELRRLCQPQRGPGG